MRIALSFIAAKKYRCLGIHGSNFFGPENFCVSVPRDFSAMNYVIFLLWFKFNGQKPSRHGHMYGFFGTREDAGLYICCYIFDTCMCIRGMEKTRVHTCNRLSCMTSSRGIGHRKSKCNLITCTILDWDSKYSCIRNCSMHVLLRSNCSMHLLLRSMPHKDTPLLLLICLKEKLHRKLFYI